MNEAEVGVDYASIEKSLADLWRAENQSDEHAVTRAALWNVVAHTATQKDQSYASEVLSAAAAVVPQRTIVIRSDAEQPEDIAAWISANCHLVGGEKQVCSEEITIVAGGKAVHRVSPLVSALLIPDMPVAFWWLGDLPSDESYVEFLLAPADRLIVDSSHFGSVSDLVLLSRIARKTGTAPADLNWVRLEEWRAAAAAMFDPAPARARLKTIRRVRIVGTATTRTFGDMAESVLFAAWLSAQAGHSVDDEGRVQSASGAVEYSLTAETRERDFGSLCHVEIEFADGKTATIDRDDERHVLTASLDGKEHTLNCVTRMRSQDVQNLIVRQLKRPEADRVFVRTIAIAAKLAPRLAA